MDETEWSYILKILTWVKTDEESESRAPRWPHVSFTWNNHRRQPGVYGGLGWVFPPPAAPHQTGCPPVWEPAGRPAGCGNGLSSCTSVGPDGLMNRLVLPLDSALHPQPWQDTDARASSLKPTWDYNTCGSLFTQNPETRLISTSRGNRKGGAAKCQCAVKCNVTTAGSRVVHTIQDLVKTTKQSQNPQSLTHSPTASWRKAAELSANVNSLYWKQRQLAKAGG